MIVLDTSVLIAYLSSGDAHHTAAKALLKSAAPGELFVHSTTLAEVLVGAVRSGRELAVNQALRDIGIRVAPQACDEPVQLARLRSATRRKLPDCCVLLAAQETGARVATFDKALASAAAQVGLAPSKL
ncbi:MAG: type II toxin-antitoxin system VapC family toxin [Bifidobacteriaceae bacterium]|nr:type II toxin-antitoxin system VapC family toxin [Bifidobacteriaceae bacterium]